MYSTIINGLTTNNAVSEATWSIKVQDDGTPEYMYSNIHPNFTSLLGIYVLSGNIDMVKDSMNYEDINVKQGWGITPLISSTKHESTIDGVWHIIKTESTIIIIETYVRYIVRIKEILKYLGLENIYLILKEIIEYGELVGIREIVYG